MRTQVSSETFLSNFMELKDKMKEQLPTDRIIFQCEQCRSNMNLNLEGIIQIDTMVDKEIGVMLHEKVAAMNKSHREQSDECVSSILKIHPLIGGPQNIIVSFPQSDTKYLKDFNIGDSSYIVDIQITPLDGDNTAIFVLYKKENNTENTYSEFVRCNFDNFLDIQQPSEELIFDDETASLNQHAFPRVVGGGRRISAEFNYICLWCPKEEIKKGKKGRFFELKNYRDHFRKHHHAEDGKGVPMSEFLDKVNICEPTWLCPNCKQHCSLGNVVRHKAICQKDQETDDSESDVEDMEDDDVVGQDNRQIRRKKKQNISQSQRTDTQFSGEQQLETVHKKILLNSYNST